MTLARGGWEISYSSVQTTRLGLVYLCWIIDGLLLEMIVFQAQIIFAFCSPTSDFVITVHDVVPTRLFLGKDSSVHSLAGDKNIDTLSDYSSFNKAIPYFVTTIVVDLSVFEELLNEKFYLEIKVI